MSVTEAPPAAMAYDEDAAGAGDEPTEMPKSHRVYVGNLAWKTGWQDLKDHMRQAGNVVRADVFMGTGGRSKGCGIVEYETAEEAQTAIATLTNSNLHERSIFVREDREEDMDGRRPRGPPAPAGAAPSTRRGRGGFRTGGDEGRDAYRGAPRGGGPGGYDYNNNGGGAAAGGGGYRGGRGDGGGGGYGSGRPAGPPIEELGDRQVFVSNLAWKTTWQNLKDLFRDCGEVVRADVYEMDGRSKGCGTVLFRTPEEAKAAIEKYNDFDLDGRTIVVRLDQGPPKKFQ